MPKFFVRIAALVFLASIITTNITFAEDIWRKIAPFRTSQGPLPTPKLKNGCKYRFAWQSPSNDGNKAKVTFESGKFFTYNKFYLSGYGFVRTELHHDDLSLLRPLLNFSSQIDAVLAQLPAEAKAVYYLSWQSGDVNPNASGQFELLISFLYPNGASTSFINLNPEDSISMEELCPNGILPAPTPTSAPEIIRTPVASLPPDISTFKPGAATIFSPGKGKIILSVRTPRLGVGIQTYETRITKLPLKRNQTAIHIKINTLGGLIKDLKPGRYHLCYRVLATDGQVSQFSTESKTIRVN